MAACTLAGVRMPQPSWRDTPWAWSVVGGGRVCVVCVLGALQVLLAHFWSPVRAEDATGASGALLLMGSGHEPRLQTAPCQQFFATDLHPLVHDLHHAAIDQTSGLEPHRNARTPLSDLQVVK